MADVDYDFMSEEENSPIVVKVGRDCRSVASAQVSLDGLS